jgi:hypothetical protein
MTNLYYIFSLIFIWMNFYYLSNKSKLDIRFSNRDINLVTKLDYFYYVTRFIFWVWIFIGLFTNLKYLFLIIITLGLLKFVFYHISYKLYLVWVLSLPIINSLIIFLILFYRFIH